MDDLGDYVVDDDLAIEPLKQIGWNVETVSWRARNVDWDRFEAVIIRSPWDYHKYPDEFLNVLRTIDDTGARLLNPLKTVEWNLSKTYLRDLEEKGVEIVPTIWGYRPIEKETVRDWLKDHSSDDVIVKPLISATARDTFRVCEYTSALKEIFRDREYMVQPLMNNILSEGEFSLMFFGGEFSHAVLKRPHRNDFRVHEEFGGTTTPVKPSERLMESARVALQHVKPTPLYTRIDFVRNGKDGFSLMELELIEPALHFRMDSESPVRFAKTVNEWMS